MPKKQFRTRRCLAAIAIAASLVLAGATGGCGVSQSRSGSESETATAASGWFRVAITLDGAGEVPFFLHLRAANQAVIVNGKEQIPCRYEWTGAAGSRQLAVVIDPIQGSRIVAEERADGSLHGIWTTTAPPVQGREYSIVAAPIERLDWELLFLEKGAATADVAGPWSFVFEDIGAGEARLESLGGGAVAAWIRTPSSDFRYLAGEVSDDGLALSFFDGFHAYLIRGRWDPEKRGLSGTVYFWDFATDTFTASRAGENEPDPFDSFALVDVQAEALKKAPVLEGLCGRPVIVEIGGTWCTVCRDALPVFRELHRSYSARGLEIIMLSLEFTDERKAAEKVARYKGELDVPFKVVPVVDMEQLRELLPGMPGPTSLPTTVFLSRDHLIHALHAGFTSKAVAEKFARQAAELDRVTREIVGATASDDACDEQPGPSFD
jgi:thiol-disulfide isomerase/thioredoxin